MPFAHVWCHQRYYKGVPVVLAILPSHMEVSYFHSIFFSYPCPPQRVSFVSRMDLNYASIGPNGYHAVNYAEQSA